MTKEQKNEDHCLLLYTKAVNVHTTSQKLPPCQHFVSPLVTYVQAVFRSLSYLYYFA